MHAETEAGVESNTHSSRCKLIIFLFICALGFHKKYLNLCLTGLKRVIIYRIQFFVKSPFKYTIPSIRFDIFTECITFIQQGCIQLIKVTVKTFILSQIDLKFILFF